MRRSRGFLQELYRDEADHGTALGWFSRLLVEREDKRHKGEVNLKHTGTMPLVQSVRLLALGSGIDATGTLDRIAGLAAHGVLTADERDNLSAAFHHLTGLLLRQQIADHQAGREVSNYVQPDGLSKRDRELMIAALRAIEALRTKVRIEFTGDVF
jgi:signal-transduction protein with cAMP-binding, CBS, and nucleotidyltransferase domain